MPDNIYIFLAERCRYFDDNLDWIGSVGHSCIKPIKPSSLTDIGVTWFHLKLTSFENDRHDVPRLCWKLLQNQSDENVGAPEEEVDDDDDDDNDDYVDYYAAASVAVAVDDGYETDAKFTWT